MNNKVIVEESFHCTNPKVKHECETHDIYLISSKSSHRFSDKIDIKVDFFNLQLIYLKLCFTL